MKYMYEYLSKVKNEKFINIGISKGCIDIDTIIRDLYKLTALMNKSQTNINVNKDSCKFRIAHQMTRNLGYILDQANYKYLSRNVSNNMRGGYYRRKNEISNSMEFFITDDDKPRLGMMLNRAYDPPYNFYLIDISDIYCIRKRNKNLCNNLLMAIGYISKRYGMLIPEDDYIFMELKESIEYGEACDEVKLELAAAENAFKHISIGKKKSKAFITELLSKEYSYATENKIQRIILDIIDVAECKLEDFDIPKELNDYYSLVNNDPVINIHHRIKFVWTLDKTSPLYCDNDYFKRNDMSLHDFMNFKYVHPDDKKISKPNRFIYDIVNLCYRLLDLVNFTSSKSYINFTRNAKNNKKITV